jgi:hypothetical protein
VLSSIALLLVLIASDLQNGHAVGFCETGFGIAGKTLIPSTSSLALPDTLDRSRIGRFGARHAARGDFHLRHRCSTVVTFETRRTAGEQLLRTERGDGDELVGIQMCRSAHHGNPLSFESCHSNEPSTFAANATMRPLDHVVAMVKRVNEVGMIGTGGGKGSSWARPW